MAEQKPFPPLSPSTLRAWGITLPLSGTGQLTMDTAFIITLVLFNAAFITVGLVIQATVIRNLKEKIREMDEEAGWNYSNAAEADRDLRQELYQTQLHVTALEKELEVRKFIMNSDRIKYFPWWMNSIEKDNLVRYLAGKLGSEPMYYNHDLQEWWVHLEGNNYII